MKLKTCSFLFLVFILTGSRSTEAFSVRNAPVVAFSIPVISLGVGILIAAALKNPKTEADISLSSARDVFDHALFQRSHQLLAQEGCSDLFNVQQIPDTSQHP